MSTACACGLPVLALVILAMLLAPVAVFWVGDQIVAWTKPFPVSLRQRVSDELKDIEHEARWEHRWDTTNGSMAALEVTARIRAALGAEVPADA